MNHPGQISKCEGVTVFRVDRRAFPPGIVLRRYYMCRYAQWIDRMQAAIQAGSVSLANYLADSEWQQYDFRDGEAGLESDAMKMMVVLEAIFEHARRKSALHLPSRLDSVFVWPALESAQKFRQTYIPGGVIHRCKAEGEAVELDGGLLPPGIDLSDLSQEIFSREFRAAQLRAEKYWAAREAPSLAELLVAGDVEVLSIV